MKIFHLIYDNHGATKHHREKVRFKIRQVGEGDGTLFTLVNGNMVKPAPPISEIVNVYPEFMKGCGFSDKRSQIARRSVSSKCLLQQIQRAAYKPHTGHGNPC